MAMHRLSVIDPRGASFDEPFMGCIVQATIRAYRQLLTSQRSPRAEWCEEYPAAVCGIGDHMVSALNVTTG